LKKSIVTYLVKRFLRFDKEQPFIFLSALLAFLGITLGVMVLLIAMALMNGFDKEFKKKLTIMNYPLTIIPKFYGGVNEHLLIDLESKFPHLQFSPYVQSSVMIRNGSRLEGGYLFGVNFEDEAKVNSVLKEAISGNTFKKFDVLIGKSLKQEFNLFKKLLSSIRKYKSYMCSYSLRVYCCKVRITPTNNALCFVSSTPFLTSWI